MILKFSDKAAVNVSITGGKGTSLASMKQAGFPVPDGFVIPYAAFRDGTLLPEVKAEILNCLPDSKHARYAVRSSATAEDGAASSFAGMFESFLDVPGEEVPDAAERVFASAQTVRVKEYAATQGFQSTGGIAVVVQEMVPAECAGVMFTADPQTSDRYTTVIEAVEGLGESLVSGHKTPASWQVRKGQITGKSKLVDRKTLLELTALGKKIEAHYGCPQDIEWCLADGELYIVQSRPITTLYPLPGNTDGVNRCYISGGHMQMMTDAVLPLGLSITSRATVFGGYAVIGGHFFIDVTHDLRSAYGRAIVLSRSGSNDPLMHSMIDQVSKRKDYLRSIPRGPISFKSPSMHWGPLLKSYFAMTRSNDPTILDDYEARMKRDNAALAKKLDGLTGSKLIDAILDDKQGLTDLIGESTGVAAIMVGMSMTRQIDIMGKKLTGSEHVSNELSKSVEHNVTSQMGIALMDIADLIRPCPEILSYLENETVYDEDRLGKLPGGEEFVSAMRDFLELYGMRCPGEVDITRTRFGEAPAALFPALLNDVKTLPAGHGAAMFEKGRKESEAKAEELIALCRQKFGDRKASKLARQISVYRNFVGAREYTKYFWMSRYWVYKQALLAEANRMVADGVIGQPDDLYYMTLEELREAVHCGQADLDEIARRRSDYRFYNTLTPPRVFFSDGEVPPAVYDTKVPDGALPGIAVSSGTVTGRARVVTCVEAAHMEKGDILVTTFTDPSWTPVFLSIAALVTEVGGMMTHGSVITREYGLPAVVGVNGATTEIHDGDIIRVDGDHGFVEILDRNTCGKDD